MPKEATLSDEALVGEIRSRDRERYADLVKRYEGKLLRYATYLVHDDQKALDVVQEAFIKAYTNLNGFDMKGKFSSWIYRIVHNEAMNTLKRHRKEYPLVDFDAFESSEDLLADITKQEIITMATECLDRLPEKYREPLVLMYLEDKSYEEISDIMRIPMGTVATRINRAKAQMKIICKTNK